MQPKNGSSRHGLSAVNKELWLLLSIFVLAALVNNVIASQQVVLGLYMLPTLFSAYFYGRRHAVMTALASITLVVIITYFHPIPHFNTIVTLPSQRWFDLAAWGGILVITGYTMGSLYERVNKNVDDLRDSYDGMMALLQQLIASSKLGQNNRLALCAVKIGETMGLPFDQIEDIRAAALLDDMEKSGISLELFLKAARLNSSQAQDMQQQVAKGKALKGATTLQRAIPILMAYHQAKSGPIGNPLPIEIQVLLLACLYDSGSQGTRLAPSQVIEKIATQKRFDVKVVEGFKHAFA
jgi:K+-sensing histidine kinase KdpD